MQKRFLTIAASALLVLGVAVWGIKANAQEPSGGGCDARPGVVAGGWFFGNGLGVGPGRPGVSFGLARARNHQARRNGPGGHEVLWVIPAEQACTLPLFLSRVLRRGPDITVTTRLVTFCIHHRPQSRHTFPADTGVRRSSHFLVQTG